MAVLIGLFAWAEPAEAAFDISMTVDGSPIVDVGQFRGVTVSYSWASLTQSLADAKIEVQLPATLDTNSTSDVQLFGSAHTTSASYDTATRKITFTFLNPLPAGSSGSVSLNTRFPISAADGTLANIVGTSSGTGEPNATDNVTLEANATAVTNLSMSKSADKYPMLGEDVVYTIRVQNNGTTNYLNPVFVDQLPAGTTFVTSDNGGTYNAGADTVTWNLATIAAGNSKTVHVTVRYNGPTFSTGQWVNNSVTGTGTDSLSAPVNLSANVDVQIVAPNPQAGVDKWDSNDPASLKGIFQYHLWVANQGNVPLTDYTVEDDFPVEFIPTILYPGSDDTGTFTSSITIFYKTNLNGSYRTLPGSPFTTNPGEDPYVDVSTIGLLAGEVVTGVRYVYAAVPVGFDANWRPRAYGTIGHPTTGADRNGAAITVPKTISNTINVTWTHSGTNYTGSDTETTDILGPSPIPAFTIYDPSPSSYIPLEQIKWTLRMENAWTASEPLINPVYATLLPANLEFVPGSTAVVEGPFTLGQITTTVTDNYNGTGRQLVKFAFAGDHPVAWTNILGTSDDWAQYIDFYTKVKAGAAAGSFEVEYHLIGSGNTQINPDQFSTNRTDTFDLDGDANTTEQHGTSNGGDFIINTSTAIDSVLWVKGQLDADFNRYPAAGFALPSGSVQYKLIVSNPGNVPLTSIRVMDILPHVGDVGVILHSQSRGSSFAPTLTSSVTAPVGITVKYSTSTNPVRTDLDATLTSPAGAVSGSFSTTAPSPLSNTKSLLFDFGALVLNPAESKEITWTMTVPAGVTIGQVAWNSFGHRSQSAASGQALPPSEPVKVGTAVPISIGSLVWNDLDNDGVQDAGESGISGATLQIFKSDGSPALDPVGNPVASATSNGSGIYAFGALADGDYFIRVALPSGGIPSVVQTADPDNNVDTDSNIDISRTPPAGTYESGIFTYAINTEPVAEPGAGGTQDDVDDNNGNMTVDFGFQSCPGISLAAISGATVGTAYSSTTSASGGVAPYSYTVAAGALPSWASLNATTGAITGMPNSSTSATFTIRATDSTGCSGTRAYTLAPACPGFTFPGSVPPPVLGLPYSASVAATGGTGPYTYSLSGAPGWLSVNAGTGQLSGTPLTLGTTSFTVNAVDATGCTGSASYTTSMVSVSIGNLVWNDLDNDGAKDAGETGLSGATVQLFSPGADNAIGGIGVNADVQVGSNFVTVTGSYSFAGLAPGKYFVKVTPPAGYIASGIPVTTDNNVDNNNDGFQPGGLGNPIFSPIIDLAVGAESILDGDLDANTNYTVDFGVWPGIQLGNHVWMDANNNAVKDVGESGISGITVELLNQSGNTVLGTTTTNASGVYGFTIYTAGNYKVRVTPNSTYPLASTSSTNLDNGVDNDNNGAQPGNKGQPSTSPTITLTAGGEPGSSGSSNNENTIDFGFRGCPTITNAPATLTGGNVGAPYSDTIAASGGVAPYTYAITGGSLPAGLTLASGTGVISGTTSVSGNHVITITATDSQGCTGATAITLPISATPTYDYGDYSPFPVASNFASTTLTIGTLIDANASNPADITASGDDATGTDDEDGFVEPINLVPNVAGSTVVKVTNTTGSTAYLNAWIDFNRNGLLSDAGEQVAVNQPINSGRVNSNENIVYTTPATALVGFNAIRVRLTSTSSPGSTGAGGMGEVEDYPVNICPTLGYAYGVQSGDLYQIDVATGAVSQAATLPTGFEKTNGAAYAQDLGTDGVIFYTTATTNLLIGAWDRATGVTNVAGDLAAFGVPTGNPIHSGDYFNGWYYFIVNNTDDLWKVKITGSSGAYTISSASKVADLWSNTRGHAFGDFVITPGGILYAHCRRTGGGPEFYTADLNQATPVATQLGSPPYMHNGITLGLDGKLYGGLGVNASNAAWFEVSLVNGESTYIRDGAVAGMNDMTMGACNPSSYLVNNDPFANSDFGDFSFVTGASSIRDIKIKLGASVDAESYISNNVTASSDDNTGIDDEDGITFAQLVQGQTGSVTVSRTNTSGLSVYLNAWIDFDNDGLLTNAERVINNVVITNGTSGSQTYTFPIPSTAYIGDVGSRFRLTSTSNPGSVGPSGLGEVEDHLANIQPALSIGNLVWHDVDNDGVKDAGESGLTGASVQLYRAGTDNLANTADDVQVGTTQVTTATGAYLFEMLAPTKYFVKVTPPAGYLTSGTPATTDNNVDDNNDGAQPGGIGAALFSPVVDLVVNDESITDGDVDPNTNLTVDFGLWPGIQLGNQVWYDANDNGVKDVAETGINSLLVELLNGATNAVITTTTTNASGLYGFTVYSAGTYKVRVTPNSAYPLPSSTFVSADNAVDNDNNGQQPGIKGTPATSAVFTLTAGGEPGSAGTSNTENTLDFGFRTCPTITVTSVPAPLDIAVMRRPYSAQINASGGMLPHTFTVASGSLPPGLSLSAGGLISGTPTATGTYNATIQASDLKTCTGTLNVSIEVLPPLSIGNLVFLDANSNGHYDAGEGINGVTVQLYSNAQTPGVSTPLATTITAGGGLYLFEGLLPGGYRIHIPAAMFGTGAPLASTISIAEGLSGDDDVGEDGVNSATPPLTGISSSIISLQVGTAPTDLNGETGVNGTNDNDYDASINLTIDFGFSNPLGVGNLVFLDANANGHYDNGEGIAGVTVDLYRDGDTPGSVSPVASQITDASGHFFFDYLLAGSYFLHVPASQFILGAPLAGRVSIPGAGTATADDNVDENGIDNLAPNLNGVRSITFALADNTEPTDATGETGYLGTEDVRDDNNYDLTIDLGFSAPDANAVGVGNTVFLDANGNGHYDSGEGISGVTLKLFPPGADPATAPALATTTSAADGDYLFTGLPAGSYFVHIPAAMFAAGAPLDRMRSLAGQGGDSETDDNLDENGDDPANPAASGVSSTVIALAVDGEPTGSTSEFGRNAFSDDIDDDNTDLTVDFGFHRPVGVGNLVFVDLNRDGGFDAGEGRDGVTVELYFDYQSPGFEPPLASTVTSGGGFYSFTELEPGYYILHIPSGQFAPGGPLAGIASLAGQGADAGIDEGTDENGSDPEFAWAEGVSSLSIALMSGTEPTDQTGENGQGQTSDNATGDADTDLTIDFGFLIGPSTSFVQWQGAHPLGGLNAPGDDPDGDGMKNLAEYALGLAPETGVLPWVPFEIVKNATTGQIDAYVRRSATLDDVTITLQGLADLAASPGGWFDLAEITPETVSTINGVTTLAYRHLEQSANFAAGKGFVRLRMDLDADFNAVPEATTTTEAWGWNRAALAAQIHTFSNPYLKPAIFTGAVNSVTGSTLDLTTAVGSESLSTAMAGGGSYFIEVLSGDHEGHRFEISEAGSTATTLVIDTAATTYNTLASPPATLAGARIVLRRHFQLSELLPPALFRATNSQNTADRVLFYSGTAFTAHWLFNNGGNPFWAFGASVTNKNTRLMPPGEALLLHPRTLPVNLVTLGVVRTSKFACPIKIGTSLLGGGWPMDQSPASRSMNVATGFKGATSAASADRIQLWVGDATPGGSGYESHYLLRSGSIQRWVRVGDASLADEMNLPLLKSMRGAYHISVLGLPAYVMPRPWTP